MLTSHGKPPPKATFSHMDATGVDPKNRYQDVLSHQLITE
jgi:hypothetical protein